MKPIGANPITGTLIGLAVVGLAIVAFLGVSGKAIGTDSFGSGAAEAGCSAKKTVILVDQTVDNKEAAVARLEEVMTSIVGDAQKTPKQYLNSTIELWLFVESSG
jgi:uncharacterized membrane protein